MLISVIVPVYNTEKYLEKCLDSLLSQTLEDIEIIAVNDGSKDTSQKILERYAQKSDKIKCFTKANGGVSDARNYGLPYATGEYIGYVDSDDFVDPDMYEVMYNKAKEQGSDIVECNFHHTYADYEDTEIVPQIYMKKSLLCYGLGVPWNKIYRREWLIGTGVTFPLSSIYEDLAFFCMLVPYIKNYAYVNIAPVHYLQRSSSLNNASSERASQVFDILRGVISFYKDRRLYEQYERELEYLYARILLCSSFEKMCRISDKAARNCVLRLNWQELTGTFPEWRRNNILKKDKSKQAKFMKMQNALCYRMSCAVMPAAFRVKEKLAPRRQRKEYLCL
jgi:glycosyltransferase involved in cell wall biosynthesis